RLLHVARHPAGPPGLRRGRPRAAGGPGPAFRRTGHAARARPRAAAGPAAGRSRPPRRRACRRRTVGADEPHIDDNDPLSWRQSMTASLTPRDRVVVMALMALNEEVTNRAFKERAGFTLEGEARKRLNNAGLVKSEKRGPAYWHQVTDDGWAWCWDEMAQPAPDHSDSGTRALYAMLAGLRRYLDGADLKLAAVFGTDPLESRIRAAYWQLAKEPGDWVGLAAVRDLLDGTPTDEVDDALRRLVRQPDVDIVPETDQRQLTPADRA